MLLGLVATAAYWGTPQTDDWWFDSLERFAHRRHIGGDTDLIRLTQAPAVMIAYAAGVSAVARRRDDLVNRLFVEPTCEDHAGSRRDQMLRILDPDLLGVPQPARHLCEL